MAQAKVVESLKVQTGNVAHNYSRQRVAYSVDTSDVGAVLRDTLPQGAETQAAAPINGKPVGGDFVSRKSKKNRNTKKKLAAQEPAADAPQETQAPQEPAEEKKTEQAPEPEVKEDKKPESEWSLVPTKNKKKGNKRGSSGIGKRDPNQKGKGNNRGKNNEGKKRGNKENKEQAVENDNSNNNTEENAATDNKPEAKLRKPKEKKERPPKVDNTMKIKRLQEKVNQIDHLINDVSKTRPLSQPESEKIKKKPLILLQIKELQASRGGNRNRNRN